MTRRERLEAKIEKRREWAEKASARSAARFNSARKIADGIPFGQPILVGHHSERHARADAARIENGMRKGCEEASLAKHHIGKATGLEHQLDSCIFSDDSDAVEAIRAKVEALEAQRTRYKAENAAFRKGDAAYAALLGVTVEQAAAARVRIMEGYSWCRQPHPTYELSNLGANIARFRKRLVDVEARAQRTEQAAAAPGGVVIEGTGDYVRVTFAEKPERTTIDALKSADFRWGGGSWIGRRDRLPAEVAQAVPA